MKELTRSKAIDVLRQKCLALVDDETSLCEVASQLQILCGGWSQWKFGELKKRYDWMVERRPRITRKELENLANRWQLARQFVGDAELACDNQIHECHHQTCLGWDEFSEEDLARFHLEMTGESVRVVPDPSGAGHEAS